MEISDSEIVNNEAKQRFEIHVQGHMAFLSYQRFPDRFVMVHTEVPPAHRRRRDRREACGDSAGFRPR